MVREFLDSIPIGATILDIGAGLMPYKPHAIGRGLKYYSHDFEKYHGDKCHLGLIEDDYKMESPDIVCDITKIPKNDFDAAICTEVLEHEPDLVQALQSILSSVKLGGRILITVPLRSQIHQAPFHFCAGFSPYYFLEHQNLGYQIEKQVQVGNQLDSLLHEFPQAFNNFRIRRFYLANFIKFSLRIIFKMPRPKINAGVLSSGDLGIVVVIIKTATK
jgi:SAM-dependent methyltransferase